MKRYKDYMDGLVASDTLHQRLTELEAPQKRPSAWKKVGAAAAALVLIAGVGAWGLSQSQGGWGALMDHFQPNGVVDHFDPAAEVRPEIAEIPAPFPNPDIATEDPNGNFTATPSGGGYEVVHGDVNDPNTMVSYYVLPYLNWADASTQPQTAPDYSLAAPSAIYRDAAWDDVLLFTGGEQAMADHLLWDGLSWSGTIWFENELIPCAAGLSASGEGLEFYLEVRQGGKVPSCAVPDGYETSQWQGVEISAFKNGAYMVTDGIELREHREVSFFFDGKGYKLTVYAVDAERADELCARFVRYAVAGGFQLDALTADGAVDRSGFSVGEPNWEDGIPDKGVPPEDTPAANILHPGDPGYIEPFPAPDGVPDDDGGCPYCADGTAHTHPYDPSAN